MLGHVILATLNSPLLFFSFTPSSTPPPLSLSLSAQGSVIAPRQVGWSGHELTSIFHYVGSAFYGAAGHHRFAHSHCASEVFNLKRKSDGGKRNEEEDRETEKVEADRA